ncbi:SLC13 family permease [Archangium lansingense]|uniref:SLC13 family permease n=1 Tax=Archangium lansingense TaxID=2995310 RepID=A0ABT3ZZW3_9BACT|nr:SLC13 family permease [Archangium lansinium]MCY1074903.1 SLC13 family permease [Archangium lansinium]
MSIAIVLGIVVIAVVLFSVEAIPLELSSLIVVCLLVLFRVLTPDEAFAGFSNDTVIFIFTLLVMTQGLASTGVVQLVGQRLAFFARYGHQTFVLAMMVVVVIFSLALSNAVTTAAFLPVAIGAATRAKVPRSKVLLPLAYASMVGGMIMIYGTSTNLVASEAMQNLGLAPIGVWEMAPVGIPVTIIGVAMVVLLGPLLLPARTGDSDMGEWALRDYLTEAVLPEGSRYIGKQLAEISEGLGLRVIGLVRDGQALPANPTLVLTEKDRFIIEGRREDMLRVKDLQGIEIRPDLRLSDSELRLKDTVLIEASVPPGSPLVGRTLKEVLFAERYGLVVLAIHRRPAIQRLTKLQMLGRLFGGQSMAVLPLSAGDVLLLRGPRSRVKELADGSNLVVVTDVEYQPPRYAKAALATLLFLGALSAGTLDVVPLSVAGLVGMILMIATGCVDSRLAFRVDWRVVLLIGSMFALGVAMEKSGAGMFLGQQVIDLVGGGSPRVLLLLLMTLTILLSAPMSNQAAALVMLPVAINAANQLGLEPRPFAIGVTVAASCSFITPLEPSCVMVYGPGHYRFSDFFRLGTPLTVVLVAFLVAAVPVFWPFQKAGPEPVRARDPVSERVVPR